MYQNVVVKREQCLLATGGHVTIAKTFPLVYLQLSRPWQWAGEKKVAALSLKQSFLSDIRTKVCT